MVGTVIQWGLLVAISLLLFLLSPKARSAQQFFRATNQGRPPGFWLLTSSLVISWLFAKSITNAANLGLAFGLVGGIAYATYYLSFLSAGAIIYRMRVKGGFESIHHFLNHRYGRTAVWLFSVLIGIRLFNEVWSNTMVIGSYFGEVGSLPFYAAVLTFTALTLAYALKGGLKSSLFTDLIQMVLFAVLLFVILGMIFPRQSDPIAFATSSGDWTMAGGLNLLFVALLQVLSYPFHDPVLTDRAFIAKPKTTLKSFAMATIIGGLCILLFSMVGIYARSEGMSGQATVEVARSLGPIMMLVMNVIMVTSAASTIDSTFSSFSKLAVVDLGKAEQVTVRRGRFAMIGIAVLGTLPVFLGPEILSATTISGTMVLGLAPDFLFWNWKLHPLTFQLAIWPGLILGIWLALGAWPEEWVFFEGKYAALLSVNIVGTVCCFLGFVLGAVLLKPQNQSF